MPPEPRFRREWRWPRFVRYQVADARPLEFMWNRYGPTPGSRTTIGACVVLGEHAYSLVWAKPVGERV